MSYALSFASAFFLQVALRLPFRLFNRRWSSPNLVLKASSMGCTIVSGSSLMLVAVIHSFDLCHNHSLGNSFIFFRRTTGLVVLPLTGPVIVVRGVEASAPLSPPRVTVLCEMLRGWSPVPVVPRGRPTIIPGVTRHVRIWIKNVLVRHTICP